MGKVLGNLEPNAVWNYFEEICQYPHPSKKEHKLANYLINWANEKGFEVQKDALGNICIRKPATPGMENRIPICIQGHIDMVCEKNADVEFDFENDPIQPYIDGDWVKAKGTTLGADNGIGLAMGMAILDSKDIPHPAFEMLCTLDEETGLTGAQQLGTDLMKAKILINLDSEEDGTFTIGCAGGQNTRGVYKYHSAPLPDGFEALKVTVKGLRGGHSGIEIHDERGNAIKFLTRLLYDSMKKFEIRISSFDAGSAHNAIPREAFATIALPATNINDFLQLVDKFAATVKKEYATKEPNLGFVAEKIDLPGRFLSAETGRNFITSLFVMPHGVIRYSPDIKGLVQTSTNLAVVKTEADSIFALTSQRSSVESEKPYIANVVQAAMECGGAEVKQSDGYPAWQPNMDSPILKRAVQVYKDLFGSDPHIQAIHAGLECGLIAEKYPGIDMLSFGPNLREVHSPDEMVQISTTKKCWDLLTAIVKNIPEQ